MNEKYSSTSPSGLIAAKQALKLIIRNRITTENLNTSPVNMLNIIIKYAPIALKAVHCEGKNKRGQDKKLAT